MKTKDLFKKWYFWIVFIVWTMFNCTGYMVRNNGALGGSAFLGIAAGSLVVVSILGAILNVIVSSFVRKKA